MVQMGGPAIIHGNCMPKIISKSPLALAASPETKQYWIDGIINTVIFPLSRSLSTPELHTPLTNYMR